MRNMECGLPHSVFQIPHLKECFNVETFLRSYADCPDNANDGINPDSCI